MLLLAFLLNTHPSMGVEINPSLLTAAWDAEWIAQPSGTGSEFEVLHFRKSFNLTEKPDQFIIHVSADNRYRLFVNGVPVCFGPARGDKKHWYFESIDIADYLNAGNNVLAAVVWNYASYMPMAQMSVQTAFIVQGNSGREAVINTNKSWKVIRNNAYTPSPATNLTSFTYYVVGSNDQVNGKLYPWNWEKPDYDDSSWSASMAISPGSPFYASENQWVLIPRDIPFLEEKEIRFEKIVSSVPFSVSEDFMKGNTTQTIPANTTLSLLLDQKTHSIAYPELTVSGGKGSKIKITYSEALFDDSLRKHNRNQTEGLHMFGNTDYFEPDGGENRVFRPLWYRTYRYVQLDIETAGEKLILNDFKGIYTAYPFEENAHFESDNPLLDKIWDAGWRTARNCAFETYYDCPYYEQLQYIGDTRIQALISLYVSGDDRLVKKALNLFAWSMTPEGITQSRYPSNELQIIPTWSLFWISMIHDYWMLRGDSAFISTFSQGIEDVLTWYGARTDQKTNMLGAVPYWNFVDWVTAWPWNNALNMGGYPPGALTGGSAVLTLQYAYTIDQAVELFRALGKNDEALVWQSKSAALKKATYELCFKADKMLMADDINSTSYSQHASIMGVLSGCIPNAMQQQVLKNVITDSSLIQATIYYKFYLARALKIAGLADLYVSQLTPWEKMLDLGLTTFAETPEPTRSDCHAWSASPNYDFLATICGIEPASAGFKTVSIKPCLGNLSYIRARMPHPNGEIAISLNKNTGGSLQGTIYLPVGTTGVYSWKNSQVKLHAGENVIAP